MTENDTHPRPKNAWRLLEPDTGRVLGLYYEEQEGRASLNLYARSYGKETVLVPVFRNSDGHYREEHEMPENDTERLGRLEDQINTIGESVTNLREENQGVLIALQFATETSEALFNSLEALKRLVDFDAKQAGGP